MATARWFSGGGKKCKVRVKPGKAPRTPEIFSIRTARGVIGPPRGNALFTFLLKNAGRFFRHIQFCRYAAGLNGIRPRRHFTGYKAIEL